MNELIYQFVYIFRMKKRNCLLAAHVEIRNSLELFPSSCPLLCLASCVGAMELLPVHDPTAPVPWRQRSQVPLRSQKSVTEDPVKTHSIPRQIPERAWYMNPVFLVPIGGILPFAAVLNEPFFYSRLNQLFYIYGFLFWSSLSSSSSVLK